MNWCWVRRVVCGGTAAQFDCAHCRLKYHRRWGGTIGFGWALLVLGFLLGRAPGAITGEVEQIGFQNNYRPDCWVPMMVSVHPDGAAGNYLVQVVQEDLDRDRVVYQRPITLAGGTAEQKFWTCFIPQPSDSGLPDTDEGLAALAAKLKVYLADASGKPLVQLSLTQPITNIDPPYSRTSMQVPTRLILVVADAGSSDVAPQFDYGQVRGVKENVAVLSATPGDLPDDCLGYESVDAIVLMNVDPAALKAENKFDALRQWVKEGGHLIICQNPQWRKMLGWGDLLPVTYPAFGGGGQVMQGAADRDDPGPIRDWNDRIRFTTRPTTPYRAAVAQAKPGAYVEEKIDWPVANGSSVSTPYLVRSLFGVGTVTWLAIDIGEPAYAKEDLAWPLVWQHVLGTNEYPIILATSTQKRNVMAAELIEKHFGLAHGIDFGKALLPQMEHAGRSASLLLLAAFFLAVYWFLAGPGAYLFLLARKQAKLSWFFFAAVAGAATALTFLVVNLVLRGPPEVHHLSIIRAVAGSDGVIRSRIGLYIPRDNPAEPVSLVGTSGDAYITPYPMHPQQMKTNAYAGYMQYTVNVRDASDQGNPTIRVPFRSTLKKLQAKWLGEQAGIEGSAALVGAGEGFIRGQLTNGTARSLQDVYLVFHYPSGAMTQGDWAIYLPQWRSGDTVDLKTLFNTYARNLQMDTEPRMVPGIGESIKGRIGTTTHPLDWEKWWFNGLAGQLSSEQDYPAGNDPYTAFVILSVFDRLPVPANDSKSATRFEMQRRGARYVDASPAIAAGALLVLGHAEGALPFTLQAGGKDVAGAGSVYCQYIIPLDHQALENNPAASTQATTKP